MKSLRPKSFGRKADIGADHKSIASRHSKFLALKLLISA